MPYTSRYLYHYYMFYHRKMSDMEYKNAQYNAATLQITTKLYKSLIALQKRDITIIVEMKRLSLKHHYNISTEYNNKKVFPPTCLVCIEQKNVLKHVSHF